MCDTDLSLPKIRRRLLLNIYIDLKYFLEVWSTGSFMKAIIISNIIWEKCLFYGVVNLTFADYGGKPK